MQARLKEFLNWWKFCFQKNDKFGSPPSRRIDFFEEFIKFISNECIYSNILTFFFFFIPSQK